MKGLGVLVLGDVSSRALLDGPRGERRVVIHREDDDLRARLALEHPTQHLESGNARKIEIEHDDIGKLGGVRLQRLLRVVSFQNLYILLPGQHRAAARDHHGMVVDDQDTHWPFRAWN